MKKLILFLKRWLFSAAIILMLFNLPFVISCNEEDELGWCQSFDPVTNCGSGCQEQFTKSKCNEYNQNKVEGKDWIFFSGGPCLPSPPKLDGSGNCN
jgi:hypothetical protein